MRWFRFWRSCCLVFRNGLGCNTFGVAASIPELFQIQQLPRLHHYASRLELLQPPGPWRTYGTVNGVGVGSFKEITIEIEDSVFKELDLLQGSFFGEDQGMGMKIESGGFLDDFIGLSEVDESSGFSLDQLSLLSNIQNAYTAVADKNVLARSVN